MLLGIALFLFINFGAFGLAMLITSERPILSNLKAPFQALQRKKQEQKALESTRLLLPSHMTLGTVWGMSSAYFLFYLPCSLPSFPRNQILVQKADEVSEDESRFIIGFEISPGDPSEFLVFHKDLSDEKNRTLSLIEETGVSSEYAQRMFRLWGDLGKSLSKVEKLYRAQKDSNDVFAERVQELWEQDEQILVQELRLGYESIKEENEAHQQYTAELKLNDFYDSYYSA